MAAATPDFWQFRRLWFALSLAGVTLSLFAIARRLDTALGTQAVWLTPWVLVPVRAIIGTLQAGNVQLLFIGAAVAAMLLFERQRHAVGGAILVYAIVSKLFPGVLLFYLLLRRDWRAVGWTAAWSVALAALTLADVGAAPFAAFLEHLPRLLSGEPSRRSGLRPRSPSTSRSPDSSSRSASCWAAARLRCDSASSAGSTRSSWLA